MPLKIEVEERGMATEREGEVVDYLERSRLCSDACNALVTGSLLWNLSRWALYEVPDSVTMCVRSVVQGLRRELAPPRDVRGPLLTSPEPRHRHLSPSNLSHALEH